MKNKTNIKFLLKLNPGKYSLVILLLIFGSFFYYRLASASDVESMDSDGDGLTDILEREYGTDPAEVDTDGDGYTDYIEIRTGYDPLKAAPGDKLETTDDNEDDDRESSTSDSDDDDNTDSTVSQSAYAQLFQEYLNKNTSGDTNLTDNLAEGSNYLQQLLQANGGQLNYGDFDLIVESTLDGTSTEIEIPTIDESELTILSDSNKNNIQDYFIALGIIIANYSPFSDEDAIEIVINQNTEVLSKYSQKIINNDSDYISKIQLQNKKLYEEVKNLPIPPAALEVHKTILESSLGLEEILEEDFSKAANDPAKNIIGVRKMIQLYEKQKRFFDLYEQLKKEYNLTLDEVAN